RREAWWKDAEILMLRHQLAVAGRERPGARARLTWPDRALLALLAGTLPIDRLAAMRLIVTPGTILRWHRDIVRRRWSRRSRRERPGWAEFLRSQAQGILALDFFTAGLLNRTKVYVLAVIEHGTRRIRVLGATGHPVPAWVVQQARNLLMVWGAETVSYALTCGVLGSVAVGRLLSREVPVLRRRDP